MNRMTATLLLTLAFFIAVIAIELNSDARSFSAPGASVESPGATGKSLLEPLRHSLPPLASLTETTARPLFAESRSPGSEAPAPVAVAPVRPGQGPNFQISAIVLTDDERAVLVIHPTTGAPVRLREGDRIVGWTLDKVEADRAVFSKEGESQSVTLRTFGPPIMGRTETRPGGRATSEPPMNEFQLRPPRRPTRLEPGRSIRQSGQ